ncbi:MAG: Mov34/MPN/PAD-1 family protein [Thermoplasmatota archaeon]
MGWFKRRRGREYVIREGFEKLPEEEWTDDEYDHWFNNLPEEEAWAQWETWSRQTVDHHTIKYLRRGALDLARAAAKEGDPLEFGAMLTVIGDTVEEIVLLPGTVQGDEHAIFQMWMQPVDSTINGSLHSHPDTHPYPSDADFALFEDHGEIHIILCRPYGPDDWRAYDHTGRPTRLKVVD